MAHAVFFNLRSELERVILDAFVQIHVREPRGSSLVISWVEHGVAVVHKVLRLLPSDVDLALRKFKSRTSPAHMGSYLRSFVVAEISRIRSLTLNAIYNLLDQVFMGRIPCHIECERHLCDITTAQDCCTVQTARLFANLTGTSYRDRRRQAPQTLRRLLRDLLEIEVCSLPTRHGSCNGSLLKTKIVEIVHQHVHGTIRS